MKRIKSLMAATSVALFLFSCEKEHDEDKDKSGSGHVYTLSNATKGNSVMDYLRSSDGKLTFLASYASGGNGSGGGLGNQGAVILTDDEILLAVNAGSNSISSFKINKYGLHLKSTVKSGGVQPVSIAQHHDIVFVLNAGGTNKISGFKLNDDGMLTAIPNSTKSLSEASTGPAQISFVNDGKVLVITEKATNKIITYTVNEEGIPGMMHSLTSANSTPFGFAVGKNGIIYASEAAGGAPNASTVSSYHISTTGMISLVDGPVSAGQTAACWVVVTNNGKYVYATNTGSGNLSSFGTEHGGGLNVLNAIAAVTGMGTSPIDAALSNNSKFLYVLNAGNESISAFSVENDGSLNTIQNVSGLPDGATGMAAK